MAELTETSRPVGFLLEPEDDSGSDSRATMMVAANRDKGIRECADKIRFAKFATGWSLLQHLIACIKISGGMGPACPCRRKARLCQVSLFTVTSSPVKLKLLL